MENNNGLGQILSDQFKKIKMNMSDTKDWFLYVPQSEVMEELRTSHTSD